jgi:uncharacterized protein with GYD domain
VVPRYWWQASYTPAGIEGVLRDGCTKRRQVVQRLVESFGGRLELFDYALGNDDALIVAQLPDAVSAVAVAMVVNAGGSASIKTSVLVAPEEVDKAATKRADYTPPHK